MPAPIGLTVAVNGSNDVNISKSGVSLTGVTATLSGSFSLAGATFDASQLQVAYTSASQTFAITGETSITAGKLGKVSVDLGGGSTQGVVITDGELISLDATASLDATLAGGTLTATGVNLVYQPAVGPDAGPARRQRHRRPQVRQQLRPVADPGQRRAAPGC